MKILLDTHFIVWLATRPDLITSREYRVIEGRDHEILASVASLWEIRIKGEALDRRGKGTEICSPAQALSVLNDATVPIEALTRDAVAQTLLPELDHTDPFDRMLLVHAQQLGARLLTRDRRLAAHPLSLPL